MKLRDQQKTILSFLIISCLLITIIFILTDQGNKIDRSEESFELLSNEYRQLAKEFKSKTGQTPTTIALPDDPDDPIIIEGIDGEDGRDGEPGIDGRPGIDGIDGLNGLDGKPGVDGKPGPDGKPGADGKPGTNSVSTDLPTSDELTSLITNFVTAYLTANPPPAGPTGETGTAGTNGINGTNGIDGRTPTPEELLSIISNYISTLQFSCESVKSVKIITCKVG